MLHQHDTIAELMGSLPHDFMAMVFNWKCFGQGDWDKYQDGIMHRQFQRCGMGHLPFNRSIKSILRNTLEFNRLGAHFPHGFQGDWSAPDNRVVSPSKATLPQFQVRENHPICLLEQKQIDHEVAHLNHYILRSKESYGHKQGSPRAGNLKDRYTEEFYNRHNRNGMRDVTATRFNDRFAKIHAEALALPDVLRLHHICCADYVAELNKSAGTDPDNDERYLHHLKVAVRVATNRGIHTK